MAVGRREENVSGGIGALLEDMFNNVENKIIGGD